MAKVGELLVDVLARTTGLQKGLKKGEQSLGKFKSAVGASIATLSQLAGVAGGFAGLGFAVKMAADAEQMRTAFGTMLQSAEAGSRLFQDLKKFAASTPLQLTDLTSAARTLLQFGIAGDQVIDTLRMLGDAAGGNAQNLQSMALAFGQISSAGKMQGGDLMQLINAGFNPLNEIAKKTGESMAELRDRMSKGKIGIDEVREAFRAATGPGGQFFQMMEKQSETLTGKFSTLRDNVGQLAESIGDVVVPALKRIVAVAADIVQWFQQISMATKQNIALGFVFTGTFYGVLKVMPFIIKALTTIKHLLTAAAAREAFLQGLRQNWVGIAAGIAAATTTSLMFADTMKDAANSSKEMAMNMHEVEAAVTRAGQAYQRANGFSIRSIHGPGRPAQPRLSGDMAALTPIITHMSMQEAVKQRMDEERNKILSDSNAQHKDATKSLRHIAAKQKRKDIDVNQAASF